MSDLLLPGQPGFSETLHRLPPDWRAIAYQSGGDANFIVRPGNYGLVEYAAPEQVDEYLEDGEFDDRCQELEQESTPSWEIVTFQI
jgi:hypothetical protein